MGQEYVGIIDKARRETLYEKVVFELRLNR
jgi:hypothetical protein